MMSLRMINRLTEKDIFNFVFFPNIIKEDKIKLLNFGKYSGLIRFYQELKKYLSIVNISQQIKLKLAEAIPIYEVKL